ncbi:hypothetical protein NDU88_013006 [Pleurodeles waltl]|uniref:Uncharacterized protein n=1 Tax=Pleurodeles waltl TaxID=8319 RepID=A0AAV7R2F3_PLEWA|nr:hypothetical protein NDU88_013006 [Pleurodeles waltl]
MGSRRHREVFPAYPFSEALIWPGSELQLALVGKHLALGSRLELAVLQSAQDGVPQPGEVSLRIAICLISRSPCLLHRTVHKLPICMLSQHGSRYLMFQLARLAVNLQIYQFYVEYIPGRVNHRTLWLSRLLFEVRQITENDDEECEMGFLIEDVLLCNGAEK